MMDVSPYKRITESTGGGVFSPSISGPLGGRAVVLAKIIPKSGHEDRNIGIYLKKIDLPSLENVKIKGLFI